MLKVIFLYIIGNVTAYLREEDLKYFTKLVFESGITVLFGKRKEKKTEKGKEYLRAVRFRQKDSVYIDGICERHGIVLLFRRSRGLPEIFRKYGKRYGFYFGGLLFAAALIFANDFVWRIEIYGNESLAEEDIEKALEEHGFSVGTYHKNIDFDIFHNRFLADSEDIAWIAVNMKGAVAFVEIREYLRSDKDEDMTPSNIVAKEDGVITQVSVFSGTPEVVNGEKVGKGQLLISGIRSYENGRTEIERAKGEVLAAVDRVLEVSVPLFSEIKTRSGEKTYEYGIKFFGQTIFFDRKGRIDTAFYDTIIVYKELSVPGCAPLPIGIIKVENTPYEYKTEMLTEEKAAALAYAEYKRVFMDATENATLLSYETTSGMNMTDDAYVISSVLTVIVDIAEEKKISTE